MHNKQTLPMIEFGSEISYARTCWLGRLAQLVEQDVYTIEVRGSSPLSPTNKKLP